MAVDTIEGFSDLEEIGSGGFATVYRARQDGLNREVALKILRAKDLDEATIRRFESECHAKLRRRPFTSSNPPRKLEETLTTWH